MAQGLRLIGCFRLLVGDVAVRVRAGVQTARKKFK